MKCFMCGLEVKHGIIVMPAWLKDSPLVIGHVESYATCSPGCAHEAIDAVATEAKGN